MYGVLESATWATAAGALLLTAFAVVEARTRQPLVPLSFFTDRTRAVANAVTVLLTAALSAAFFLLMLYMQDIIGCGPLQAGLAFLPFCAALFLAISQVSRLIGMLGTKHTETAGLAFTAAGLAWLARLPGQGDCAVDVLPDTVGVAAGMGIGLIALQSAALQGVTGHDAGTAAGVQRSVDQLGGALGLEVLVGVSMGTDGAEGFRTAFLHALVVVRVAAVGLSFAGRVAERRPDPGSVTAAPSDGRAGARAFAERTSCRPASKRCHRSDDCSGDTP